MVQSMGLLMSGPLSFFMGTKGIQIVPAIRKTRAGSTRLLFQTICICVMDVARMTFFFERLPNAHVSNFNVSCSSPVPAPTNQAIHHCGHSFQCIDCVVRMTTIIISNNSTY